MEEKIKLNTYSHPVHGKVRGCKAKVFLNGISHEYKCPFCGHHNSSANAIKMCGNCHRSFFKNKSGDIIFVD